MPWKWVDGLPVVEPGLHRAKDVCLEEVRSLCTLRNSQAASTAKRIAVLVAGLWERFYPTSMLRHVVMPAAKAGYEVDMYVLLCGSFPEGPHGAYWYRPVPDPWIRNLTVLDVEEYLILQGQRYGARRVGLFYQPNIMLDELPRDPSWTRWYRHGERNHNSLIRNLLWLQAMETVWNWTLGSTSRSDDADYGHYVLVRGDLHWVDDLDMAHFPDQWTAYFRGCGALCKSPPNPGVPDDRAFVLGGQIAGQILRAYTAYFHNRNAKLDPVDGNEEFIVVLAQILGVRWELVRKDWLPFFAALHTQQPGWKEPLKCLRGIRTWDLENPSSECVHPKRIRLPLCEDFPLQ